MKTVAVQSMILLCRILDLLASTVHEPYGIVCAFDVESVFDFSIKIGILIFFC